MTFREIMKSLHLYLVVGLIAMASPTVVRAQYTTGTIHGTVFDTTGAVVSGATVTLQSRETDRTAAFITGTDGGFVFSALLPGQYLITVDAQGFAKSSVPVAAFASQTVTANVTVNVHATDIVIGVEGGGTAVINTNDPQLTTTYDADESNDLPTDRTITGLVALAPGVAPMYSPSGGGLVKVGGAQTGLITANGGRPENTNVEFDFTDANDWEFGGFALGTQPQPDMVQQFNILTSNVPAEYGIKSNGQIEMITKSGTNDWHGQAYEYLQNNFFNATDPVLGTATRIDENNYGFSTGGAAIHDKTFLFGGWQQNKTIGGGFTDFAAVPTQTQRNSVTDPTLTNLINEFLPLPTTTVNGTPVVPQTFSSPQNNYQFLLRGDQRLASSNTLSIRYFQGTGTLVLPFPQFNTLAGFDADLHYEARNANVTDTWNINPNTVNQFRFAYARSLGLLPPENDLKSPRFTISDGSLASFGALPYFTQGRIFNVYQANDIVSQARGKHLFKLGFDFRYIQDNSVNQTNDNGSYFFANTAAFLAAQPDLYTQAFGPTELGFREKLFSAFLQDDFRVRPTLAINLGLRWEYQGAVTEAHGLTSLLDPSIPGGIGDAGPGVLGTFRIGNPAIHANPLNFGPRLGFAWNPNAGKFVLRGGYGIYYDSFNFTALSEARTTPPLNYTFSLGNFAGGNTFDNLVAGTAPFITQSQAQVGSFGTLTNFGTITTVNPNLPNPYSQQWDLVAEYQISRSTLASVAYVGSKGTHLQAFIPINPIAPANIPAPAVSAADEAARISEFSTAVNNSYGPGNNRLDPRFDQVNTITAAASSSYNSLQLSLRENFQYGLSLQASYTYSRSIDNSSSSNPNQESFDPGVQQNVNALYLERGPSNYDIPHRIVVTGVWNIPFFQARDGLLSNLALKGWQFSSTSLWQSGIPANIYSGPVTVGTTTISDVNIDGVTAPSGADNTRANCATGGVGFKLGDSASIAAQTRYSQPLLGNDGTCGRNSFRLNSLANFNWAISKSFQLTESGPMHSGPWALQFRTEIYNVFNDPNRTVSSFANLTLTNPRFGLFDTAGSPRTLQLALKLIW